MSLFNPKKIEQDRQKENDKSNLSTLSIKDIYPDPQNDHIYEVDEDRDRALEESVREHGILQPLLLRPHPSIPGKFMIVAGHRRYRAAIANELTTLPVMVFQATGEKTDTIRSKIQFFESNALTRQTTVQENLEMIMELEKAYALLRGADESLKGKWTTAQGGYISLDKCFYINNGVELSSYYEEQNANRLDDADLNDGKFHVVYVGAIRKINNVGNILDVASILRDNHDISFLIYGDGNEAEVMCKRIFEEGLTNVKMKGFVERKYIPYILSRSSVNLLNYSHTEYNWSRGNSSNKLFEYMASGRPVISTVKMGYSIIEKYDCGIELDEHTPDALATAIMHIKDMPAEQYATLCQNAREGAKDFDYKNLSNNLLDVINQTLSTEGL
jgi:glycosyltransferase involved in cell wall biosynthesis